MFANLFHDLPGAFEICLNHKRVAGFHSNRFAAIGSDDDAALQHVDKFVSGVSGVISAGCAFPYAGEHGAVRGSVQCPGFHRRVAFGLDPAVEVAGIGLDAFCLAKPGYGLHAGRLFIEVAAFC